MTKNISLDASKLNSIFHECNQCGTCCKQYRKITLHHDEVEQIKKLGGYVGVDISIKEIREKGLQQAREDAEKRGKVFMIHPDDKGCIFLEKRNDKYVCKIYHYRPRTCRGFKCNMADDSFLSLFGRNAIHLLGQTTYGLPLKEDVS
ncbi:YkgJ family cysteine cluster protein [Desulfotalea psychrophila]|uniref:YkgJ family cysteine cluster protein n=1 Tax=Desulfotalea psychrophila (strain LSv54 / DSM 12343) TaxID=177439 RepID=Q6AKN3_DESPS|nr:YkgJ family cysteine cluster protein [Desulfotalea psychrophila]CAG37092.1 hypothetical protein DP2363 [Desulfotalea psychrophila LSv54]